ncbi:hypothetical protein PSSM2_211 [Prochlorococcus phage P-SSM2]|uniref:Uncharacterized protein n=1 Tax=Prochlorococcus phage P-SSM2 TaxID=268746 RepID=Q58ME4_BPPRM|nr:hypothetical protein PSSM2_211 [Prochlorococcus phage P-SSM2]AAX44588.1 hypothetical protein PSSM2_211 [Prochlorococcus phage P-SSM2]ACY76090.1 conserved hypothetical protein [Prochlorococcus phage P-SSM2]
MKSLSQFIIETQSGSNKPSTDPWFPDEDKNGKNKKSTNGKKKSIKNTQKNLEQNTKPGNKSNKGIDPKEVNKRLSASTTKGDQARSQYNTSGIQGDSNVGDPTQSKSNTPKKTPTPKPKPLTGAERNILQKTNRQSGGKISVNFAEPIDNRSQMRSIEGDPQSNKIKAEVEKSVNQKTREFTQKKGVTSGNEFKYSGGKKPYTKGADKLLDKIFNVKKGEKKPVNPKTGSRIPDLKKGELGKLYQTSTKADPKRGGSVRTTDKINQELTAKRAARINPKTGKATRKGVENFAINQQTKGLSTKGDAGKQAMANAKKIAGNARSAAYKDIANKINTSDYAGKRAKLASTKELDRIVNDIKTSKTISRSVDVGTTTKAPTVLRKPLSSYKTSLNTATRKVKITPLTKTSGIKYKPSETPKTGNKTFSQFRNVSGQKSNLAKLKIKPGRLLGKGFAAWNAIDNYKAAKGSPLRKLAKSAVTTAAYYKGGTAGASLGTGFGAITGPGAVVTGTAGFIAGSETASNLTSRAFDKVWKPPTTKTKDKDKNKKIIGGTTSGGMKPFKWKSGIAIESGPKK